MHKKETIIQPIFKDLIGAIIETPHDYNTDQFGTFSGEIPREGTAKETAFKKALFAMEKYNYSYGLASEGSFGPHPAMPFFPQNIETIVFIDKINNIILYEQENTNITNYCFFDFTFNENFEQVLEKMKFPSHGLIVRAKETNRIIAKGIHNFTRLNQSIEMAFLESTSVRLETDMRAMHNPTRMLAIASVAKKIANRLLSVCPHCSMPGFGEKSYTGNLPCQTCGSETKLYSNVVFSCLQCHHQEIAPRPDHRKFSDPTYCQYCNP